MKKFTVRPAEPRDSANYVEWLKQTDNNADYGVYQYPTCNTVVVEKETDVESKEPVLINSFHLVIMLEALAPKPDLSPRDEAKALNELFDGVKRIAEHTNVREIYFGCKDENLGKFFQKHGGEKMPLPMYRFKLAGSEPQTAPAGVE